MGEAEMRTGTVTPSPLQEAFAPCQFLGPSSLQRLGWAEPAPPATSAQISLPGSEIILPQPVWLLDRTPEEVQTKESLLGWLLGCPQSMFLLPAGANGQVAYGGLSGGPFSIDPQTGLIVTTRVLDREEQEQHVLTSRAAWCRSGCYGVGGYGGGRWVLPTGGGQPLAGWGG